MCGIAGIIGNGVDRRSTVERMTDVLFHRGPDDSGHYHDEHMSMGQRRLAIIDLNTGHQPISNEDDTLQLVCNGEIYNSPELRAELITKGHQFKTASDVEVILHLYEEYGRDCVKYLRGMFAFALWDTKKRLLFVARDHMGQKPLFFYQHEAGFVFASEVKAILACDLVQPEIELEAIWHYVSMRFVPDQYSMFKGIQKLPAGSSLYWQDGNVRVQRYWDIDFNNKIGGSVDDIEQGLHDVLYDAVKSHLLSDVRVGAFLSGGIDSSTVSAMMAKEIADPVPVFSIGVKEQSYNELPYARMVVDRYGLEGHEKIVEADLVHLIPTMIQHLDEPADPFGVGVYLVSSVAKEYVKVVLTGDGGDENFAGYDRFAGQRLADYYAMLPLWVRKSVMKKIISLIPESFEYKTVAQKARWMNEVSMYDRGERYAHSLSILRFTPESKAELFSSGVQQQIECVNSDEKILQFFDADNANDLVDKMLYTDLMTRMPDHLLTIADRMTMAHSIESRAPLIDHKLVEYAASIPAYYKLKGNKIKYILRKVAARYLPDELVYRKKQGFGFPIAQWIRSDLSGFLQKLFAESRFVELGIFEQKYMQELLDEHLSGKVDHNFRLWILLNLELWYRIYFENQSMDEMREYTDQLMAA